jgi:hypothetical protein
LRRWRNSYRRRLALDPNSSTFRFASESNAHRRQLVRNHESALVAVQWWREQIGPDDARAALEVAKTAENKTFKFLNGKWRAVKKLVEARYDFSHHQIRPSVASVLETLVAFHDAAAALQAHDRQANDVLGLSDTDRLLADLGPIHGLQSPLGVAVRTQVVSNVPIDLVLIEQTGRDALDALANMYVDYENRSLASLGAITQQVLGSTGSIDLIAGDLGRLAQAPPEVVHVVRTVAKAPEELERLVYEHTLNSVEATNADVARLTSAEFQQTLDELARDERELRRINGLVTRARVRSRFVHHVAISESTAAQLSSEEKLLKKSYAPARRELEHEFNKSMRYRAIRDLVSNAPGPVVMDLRPVWLMSPLSVSDTLPLDPEWFDVVIYDEASQIPLEEAIPALYRSHQTIVVGDQMQLPPTQFFSATVSDDDDLVDDATGEQIGLVLDGDSFLAKSDASLPSTMLQWHYRSRSEELIGFSNARFYGGALATIPDRQRGSEQLGDIVVPAADVGDATRGRDGADALLGRNISFHFVSGSVYEDRCNAAEASYIAQMVRELLMRENGLSIGIAAFSEAQQGRIEQELESLARQDGAFAERLEAEELRQEDGQDISLFVKNLENLQGDERDVIIMSVCYGPGPNGRMLMNFGPINQRGGEKRLNVIFSRAKRHMAIVSSIHGEAITNEHNDGALALRRFLEYAEAQSRGADDAAMNVLERVNPLRRAALRSSATSSVVAELAQRLRARGLLVETDYGRSRFRCDLAVRAGDQEHHQVAVLVDTEERVAAARAEERAITHTAVLQSTGWNVVNVLTKNWWEHPDATVERIVNACQPNSTRSQ